MSSGVWTRLRQDWGDGNILTTCVVESVGVPSHDRSP